MNQAAIDRKRKLQEIREKSNKKSNISTGNDQQSDEQEKTIKFRNYQPRDAALVKAYVNKGTKGDENISDKNTALQQAENPSIGDCDIIRNELRQFGDDEELNILPKNNNWDLKKQLEPLLEKLRRRTQRAIVDILRQKIAEEEDSDEDDEEGEED